MTATNSVGSTGFETCICKPAESVRIRSSTRAEAVSATAGILFLFSKFSFSLTYFIRNK
jgi:hypothetical protein